MQTIPRKHALLAPPLFCRFAHSVTGLPCIFRKVGSPGAIRSLQKQEIGLLCNFFSIGDSLSCSREEKTVHHMGNFLRFRAHIRILSLCDNP